MYSRRLCLLVWTCILLTSCQSDNEVLPVSSETPVYQTSTQTPTIVPTNTSTLIPTIAPIETYLGKLELVYQLGRGNVNKFSVSPDGDALVVASSTGVWIYKLPNGEILDYQEGNPVISISNSDVADIVWSPDGNNLAVSNAMRGVWIWDTNSWILLTKIDDAKAWELTRSFASFTWSPDSTKLALDTGLNGVWIWDRQTNSWENNKTNISEGDLRSDISYSHQGIMWNEDDGLQILIFDKLFSTESGKPI